MTPTTEAGRRLRALLEESGIRDPERGLIRDVERQAGASERARIRAALTADAMRDVLIVLPPPKNFADYGDAVRHRLIALLEPGS
jgi:hypothetical protein